MFLRIFLILEFFQGSAAFGVKTIEVTENVEVKKIVFFSQTIKQIYSFVNFS